MINTCLQYRLLKVTYIFYVGFKVKYIQVVSVQNIIIIFYQSQNPLLILKKKKKNS